MWTDSVFLVSISALFTAVSSQLDPCKTDILFLLDKTGSVQEEFAGMKTYVKGVVKVLDISPRSQRIGLIIYHGDEGSRRLISYRIGYFRTEQRFLDEVNKIKRADGTTHVARALRKAYQLLEQRREKRQAVVIVVSDGNQFDSNREVALERDKILALPNVNIYAAGTEVHSGEDHINEDGLAVITGDSRKVFEAPNDLRDTLRTLSTTIACAPPPPPTTTTTTTTTPKPTTTTLPPTGCELDLLFIIDSSSSVDQIHKEYINRAIEVVERVRIGPRYTQVSMIRYSSKFNTFQEFHFNTYFDKNQIIEAIRNAEYRGGTTNTYWALMMGKEQYETKKYGARQHDKNKAAKIALIFTDGFSQKSPLESAEILRRTGVDVHVCAVTQGFYRPYVEELEIIAGNRNKVYVNDAEFDTFLRFMNKYNCR